MTKSRLQDPYRRHFNLKALATEKCETKVLKIKYSIAYCFVESAKIIILLMKANGCNNWFYSMYGNLVVKYRINNQLVASQSVS